MADFFNAALPFVAMGLTIALLAANGRRGRKNYLTEGMCLGLALGVGLADALHMELGLAMSLGMLLGRPWASWRPKAGRNLARRTTMKPIDRFSYELGAADCFCEMVRAGVKRLALAHPCDSPQERDQYLPYFEELCRKYGVKLYVEDEAFLTDLFPLSLNQGKYNALFYQEDSALQEYLALKGEKKAALPRAPMARRAGTSPGGLASCSPTPTRASGGCWRATQRKSETSPWRQPGGFLCKGACPSGWNGWLSGGLLLFG